MFLCLILLVTAADTVTALQARCHMQLHNDGTDIGEVIFTSNGNQQRIEAYLKADPAIIREGGHGLHIHNNPVKRNDCSTTTTGGHFNPDESDHGGLLSDKTSRHMGDLGNVRAGERGEINQVHRITVDPMASGETSWGLIEPVMYCPPEPHMLWPDGRVERITNLKNAETRRQMRLAKGKPTFTIVYKEPDCYQPVWNRNTHVVHNPKFALEGEKSIVGRAIVLQGNVDYWYRGDDGNPDKAIACCTLELVAEEA
jgi:Cu/Zn superoxide dismutase